MCLIVFAWQPQTVSGLLFTLTANRDEFFSRTSAPLCWWEDTRDVLAGRDLEGGGTWLGVSRDGRFAALTNYRAPFDVRAGTPTRGKLVSGYLSGPASAPLAYLEQVAASGALYNGFSLLVGDWTRRELGWYCNRPADGQTAPRPPAMIEPGTHGLSNAHLDTPWPKLAQKRRELGTLLTYEATPPLDTLIELLRDPRTASDETLPRTGIPLERERALSAAFIETPEYGSRSTTALQVTLDKEGRLSLSIKERGDDDGSHQIVRPGGFERSFTFNIDRTNLR